MKTRLLVLATSLLVSLGLVGCYTEFATTGGNYGGYGSSYNSSSSYYDSADSGYAYYDTTNAPIVNNYNYYGYGYGYGYPYYGSNWYYQNMFVPDMGWWNTDSWYLGLSWGNSYGGGYPMYGGFGFSQPYGYYSPYYSYYNPYYPYSYSPWWGYSYGGSSSGASARPRNFGDTRYGREGYGGGGTTIPQPVGAYGSGQVNAVGGGSATRSVEASPTARSRGGEPGTPSSSSTNNTSVQSGARVRGSSSTPPPQQTSNPAPNAQPSSPQPRVRENAPSNNPPPQQNSTPNSQPQPNSQPRVRERAPSYTPPPQQNPAPSYNPPPQQNPAPSYNPPPQSAPPSNPGQQQAPPPRIRHGAVAYNMGGHRYILARQQSYPTSNVRRVITQRNNYVQPVREIRSYEVPHFQRSAPSFEYRAASIAPRGNMTSVSASRAPESSARATGGGRARH